MNIPEVFPVEEENFNIRDSSFYHDFSEALYQWIPEHRELVIACVGTDRSTGDSFGPFVGSMLEEQELHSFHVLGTIEEPLHAGNLEERLSEIHDTFEHPFVIAVDACLGRVSHIGSLNVAKGPLSPGAALKKELPKFGEAHINGIVNVQGFMEFAVLQNTRLHTVLSLASATASALLTLDAKLKSERIRTTPYNSLLNRGKKHVRD
ncbi:spore protease YyaC [Salimicrobium flavidum]|uniref:Putative sporulation protein YyaC n=1 Tax=Salimicrobium flavidum TaxID=570947 RepID=A0A1N7JZS0_9BACI|nr:spore protease YyaC [Salimicrobium flavidum]SIS54817.1 putative sporulation protein YyaC [Salimicrobium flavidum]